MYPPTYHPGLYDKPERKPYIDVGALFRLLFHPKEAFEDLYDHTTSTQGWILAIIFIVVSGVVGLAANLAIVGSIDLPDEVGTPGVTASSGLQSIIGIFTNILFFFLTAWLFFSFVKDKARKPDMSKTIGLMGYAKFPMFIIGLVIAVLTPMLLLNTGWDPDNPDTIDDAVGGICAFTAAILGLSLLGFFWALWVHSHAQSVANDVSSGTAMGYMFLTWFLIFLLTIVVGVVIALVTIGTAF
jgi:hypothetical protein